jgi:hypothetical protein
MPFPRHLSALLCGGFLLLGSAQAQTPPKEKPPAAEKSATKGRSLAPELRACKLRLAWWSAPENPPELALQMDKNRTPFSPDIMALSQVIEYRGEPNAVVLKRTVTAELDKAGKPIVAWLPYCTIPVGENNTDLAVLLFPDDKRDLAQTRVFDFSPEAFPYGTVQLVNFTTAKIAVSIDGTTFVANSRGMARYPKVFDKVSVSRFYMAAAENSGEQRMLRSTTMIFKPTARILLFAVEVPDAPEDGRYHTELIIDNMGSRPVLVEAPDAATKGKSTPGAGGKKAGKGAPTPEQPI